MKKLFIFITIGLFALNVQAQTTTIKPKKTTSTTTTSTTTTTHTTATHTTPAKPVQKPAPKPAADEYSVMNKNFLDPNIGLGTYYKGLPFGVSFEHGFTDEISAGVFANYSSYNYSDIDYKLNIFYVGVRGSYHFAKLFNVTNPKFDPYGGVSLGYYNVSASGVDDFNPYSSSLLVGIHAGVRYMFSDAVGGFAEAGYGVSALQVGVSFKF